MTLPYPYHVDGKGLVGRQDFWKGRPSKLLGFNGSPKSGSIDLSFKEFIKNTSKARGKYPVFECKNGDWFTSNDRTASVRLIDAETKQGVEK